MLQVALFFPCGVLNHLIDLSSEKAALSPKYEKFEAGNGTGEDECLGWWIAYVRSEDSGDGGDGKAAKTSCLKTSANWMWKAKADLEDVPLSKVTFYCSA